MATTEGIAERKVHLRVLVHKETDRVIFAEADKDFVDILFSFLTLPLGTIVRLLNKCSDSSSTKIGSLSSLYEGVANIGAEHFWTDPCKDILLNPRNSAVAQCRELKINIDDSTDPTKYFYCGTCRSTFSTNMNTRCTCGGLMSCDIINKINEGFSAGEGNDGVFVPEKASFIITDDLQVIPNVAGKSIALLTNLGISDMNKLNIHPLDVGTNEILLLLKWSVLSETPLTNLITGKLHLSAAANAGLTTGLTNSGTEAAESCNKMSIRVMVQKSNQKIVFAQVEEDFVNFLFSFLTIPLGSVVRLLGGKSSLGSIDNLYSSILCLNVDRYIKSQDLKDMLLDPKLGTNSLHKNQILPVIEDKVPILERDIYGYNIYLTNEHDNTRVRLTCVDPEKPNSGCKGLGGFVRAPALFNVTNDLLVTPVSSMYAISAIDKLRIPFTDVEEKVVNIGMKEALGILKCSLTSTSALTDSLKLFLKSPKQEP